MRAALLLALALLVPATLVAFPAPASAAAAITWHDFEEGMNLSLNQRIPTMADFSTSWCTYCRQMDAETFSDARVIDRAGSLVSIKVDGDARGDLTAKYNVTGYPTIIFFNPDGSEKHRVVGYKGPDDFLKDIDFVLGQGPRPVESKGICAFALLPLVLIPAVVLLRRK